MNNRVYDWALRHQISFTAIQELQLMFGIAAPFPGFDTAITHDSEAHVQSIVRLEAARKGVKLWRNNVGVLMNEGGIPVRYGLANDSPKLNSVLKSGDLIGWRPLVVTQAMIGSRIAQFVSRECKRSNWTYTQTEHEEAQLKWAQLVVADGGDAQFVTTEGSL